MTEAKPLISAVVTTHNRPRLLPRALDSVAAQTYPNLELVLVDDGSAEDVQFIADRYRRKLPVQYIRNSTAMGACRARNQGIEAASGTFIAGLDDDDEWHPERVEKMFRAYSGEYSFVTSDVQMIYPNGKIPWKKKEVLSFDDLLYSNAVGNQGLIKKDYLLEAGGFDESLEAAQDYDLWLRLCERFGPVKNVQENLQDVYQEDDRQRISNPRDQLRGYLGFYNKHKHKMNRRQQKYQLYNIRKATGKDSGIVDLCGWVPPHRYWKEIKYLAGRAWFSGSEKRENQG
ncbi:MAG: glycosyltransferase [Balneolaceae bacterium]